MATKITRTYTTRTWQCAGCGQLAVQRVQYNATYTRCRALGTSQCCQAAVRMVPVRVTLYGNRAASMVAL